MYHSSSDNDHRKQPVDRDLRRIARLHAKLAREAESDDEDEEPDPLDLIAEEEGCAPEDLDLDQVAAALEQADPEHYAERPTPGRAANRLRRIDELQIFCDRWDAEEGLRHPQDLKQGKGNTDADPGQPIKNSRNGVPDFYVTVEPEPEEEADEWAQTLLADRTAMLASRRSPNWKPG
jgi:hypothetical protein